MAEELDYRLEADAQRAFAAAYAGDAEIAVPRVVASAPKVVVSEWMDGTPLSRIIRDGTSADRDRAGTLLATLHYSAPERARMLHADPHPGNFRHARRRPARRHRLRRGRPAAATVIPSRSAGSPARPSTATRDEVLAIMREQRFVRPGIERRAAGRCMDYLGPIVEPLRERAVHLLARVAARAGRASRRPAPAGGAHRPAVQPAAVLSARPPGHARLDRGAVPARRHRAVPRTRRALAARLRGQVPLPITGPFRHVPGATRAPHWTSGEQRAYE